MADYLEKHILDLNSDRKAMWRCAYDCCPLGFTTYAVNCIESYWRALKCLLDLSIKWANCGQLMIEVAAVVISKFDKGDYAGLFHLREEIWFCLNNFGANVLRSTRRDTGEETVGDPRAVQKRRLDVETIRAYLLEHGQEQLYMKEDCDIPIGGGVSIIAVFAMPKYTLAFGKRREALQEVIHLAMAQTCAEVVHAVQSPTTKTYDINRHMHLRHTYVSVLVYSDGRVVDSHKHWMQAAGQSEHASFFASLVSVEKYPLNSQPSMSNVSRVERANTSQVPALRELNVRGQTCLADEFAGDGESGADGGVVLT